jgi:hypothetical protein
MRATEPCGVGACRGHGRSYDSPPIEVLLDGECLTKTHTPSTF